MNHNRDMTSKWRSDIVNPNRVIRMKKIDHFMTRVPFLVSQKIKAANASQTWCNESWADVEKQKKRLALHEAIKRSGIKVKTV